MSESRLFKDYYGLSMAQDLAERIKAVYPDFAGEAFVAYIVEQIGELELKDRVKLMAKALREHLPSSYPEALKIVLAILGPEMGTEDGMFKDGWYVLPLAQFVESYGLDYFDESIAVLYEITKRNTAEFAIRPFLVKYPERTLEVLMAWTRDQSPHVRRLVSEGTRTRLPWASRLTQFIEDPTPVLKLLAELKNDPERYVQRSVANNLNDIAKDHAECVLETLQAWHKDGSEATRWIIRHALGNRIKQGDPAALSLLGYGKAVVTLTNLSIEPQTIKLGDTIVISFTLQNDAPETQNLVIDYLIYFVRASGQHAAKVFKLKTQEVAGGAKIEICKKHSFKPVTVRRYYPGKHRLEIQVNGQVVGGVDFYLED